MIDVQVKLVFILFLIVRTQAFESFLFNVIDVQVKLVFILFLIVRTQAFESFLFNVIDVQVKLFLYYSLYYVHKQSSWSCFIYIVNWETCFICLNFEFRNYTKILTNLHDVNEHSGVYLSKITNFISNLE